MTLDDWIAWCEESESEKDWQGGGVDRVVYGSLAIVLRAARVARRWATRLSPVR